MRLQRKVAEVSRVTRKVVQVLGTHPRLACTPFTPSFVVHKLGSSSKRLQSPVFAVSFMAKTEHKGKSARGDISLDRARSAEMELARKSCHPWLVVKTILYVR